MFGWSNVYISLRVHELQQKYKYCNGNVEYTVPDQQVQPKQLINQCHYVLECFSHFVLGWTMRTAITTSSHNPYTPTAHKKHLHPLPDDMFPYKCV